MGYREESISNFEKFYQPLLYYVWLLYEFNLRKIPNLKLDKFRRLYIKGEIYISHNIYMQSWNTMYVPSRLSLQWLCGNSCTWAHDPRLHHDAQSLQMLQEVLPTVDQHFPPSTKFYEIFNKNRNNVEVSYCCTQNVGNISKPQN